MKRWFLVAFSWLVIIVVSCRVTWAAEVDFPVGARGNIVLLGDSITADGHYGQLMQEAIDARYPERQIRVLSRGGHGDTVRRALQRVETDVVQWRPAWVLINFGVNDANQYSSAEFLRHYEALINRLSRDTAARIAVVSPIYQDRDEESPKMRDMVAGLIALAKRYDTLYIPVYETTKRLRPTLPKGVKYAPDGIHPNAIGYQIFAQTILQAMGFPSQPTPLNLSISSLRVAPSRGEILVGQRFQLALPQPVWVQIINPSPPQATSIRAHKSITLDGKLDEWDQSAPLVLERPDQRVWGVMSWPRDHFRARAFTSYDDEAWYFGIDVEDSVLGGAVNPPVVVDRDCIELCLDLRPQAERAAKPALNYAKEQHIAQLILVPASSEMPEATVFMGTGDTTFLQGATVASSVTKLGYQIEFRLPRANFPDGRIAPGLQAGFDFAVVNVDRNARYLEATSFRWSGSTASAFSTREFGTLRF